MNCLKILFTALIGFSLTVSVAPCLVHAATQSSIKECKDELKNGGFTSSYDECFEACVNPDLTSHCGIGKNPGETAKMCDALCCGLTDCKKKSVDQIDSLKGDKPVEF